jgi:hypothetical protein
MDEGGAVVGAPGVPGGGIQLRDSLAHEAAAAREMALEASEAAGPIGGAPAAEGRTAGAGRLGLSTSSFAGSFRDRLYTPPVVPVGRSGLSLSHASPPHALIASRKGSRAHPAPLGGGGASDGGPAASGGAHASAGGAGAPSADLADGRESAEGKHEDLDLMYDPMLNCYYDPKTNKYYELA